MEQKARYHRETVNGCAFRMRYLEGGVFEMGSDETEKAFGKESPIHKVEISPFYIGEYLVTQGLWKAVMGADHNPSRFIGDDRPVERVSWIDIVEGNQGDNGQPAFLQKLNEWTKTSRPKGYVYRLPTEAEWEYAARGGESYQYVGSDQLKEVGWYGRNSHGETKAVGLKRPNGFHLYDMSGNVREWCLDRYVVSFYQECYDQGIVTNPLCGKGGTGFFVFRGGYWGTYPQRCRVSYRSYSGCSGRDYLTGFRLALAQAS